MQHKSNRTLCPVKAWGKLIALILLYKNTTKLTPIRYFEDKNIPNQISTEDMIVQIREACKTIGEGFHNRYSRNPLNSDGFYNTTAPRRCKRPHTYVVGTLDVFIVPQLREFENSLKTYQKYWPRQPLHTSMSQT